MSKLFYIHGLRSMDQTQQRGWFWKHIPDYGFTYKYTELLHNAIVVRFYNMLLASN